MPLAIPSSGEVLSRIDDLPFQAALDLPRVTRYEADTPCMIPGTWAELVAHHDGFVDWLNVAVVWDTCD